MHSFPIMWSRSLHLSKKPEGSIGGWSGLFMMVWPHISQVQSNVRYI
jgi:hypothetical protein